MLVAANIITQGQLNDALERQKKDGGRLGSSLVKLGFVSEERLVNFLSKQFGVPSINLESYKIDSALFKVLPPETARKYTIVPVARAGNTLTIAMPDPSNVYAVDDVKFMTGYNVEVAVASESSIVANISEHYGLEGAGALARLGSSDMRVAEGSRAYDYYSEEEPAYTGIEEEIPVTDVEDFDSIVGDALEGVEAIEQRDDSEVIAEVAAPIIKLLNGILVNAVKRKASDIHIEPYENAVRVRYRVDGVLFTVMSLPLKIKNPLTSRVKIIARMDIAERRLPQDGRIKLRIGDSHQVDFRASVVPTLHGEKCVLRILDKGALQVDLKRLGFDPEALTIFMEALDRPFGMVLVTGPTGSGKTTTLYSAITHLNKPGINIMTAEDPVEYNFSGINQLHVREEIGLTFASALRSFLRQDPDVIMVGEVRDFETAEIAVKAALTGHLVLSTLHTNDAPSTVNRLLNMGIEPFLVSSSVILVVAQRLARRLCPQCKEFDPIKRQVLEDLGFSQQEAQSAQPFKPKGCPACGGSGYKGRVALYEVLPMKEDIRQMVLDGASADELKRAAIAGGMRTLRRAGIVKVIEGTTSIDEVMRVTFGD